MMVVVKPSGAGEAPPAAKKGRITMAERRALRDARRRGWRAQKWSNSKGCCSRHAKTMFICINIGFILVGILALALGIWAASSVWAEFIGRGPGYFVAGLGAGTIITALCGLIGMKRDNKCLLLLYFLTLTLSFIIMAVLGGVAFFSNSQFNSKFSGWWDEFPEAAARGEIEFNCCGYANLTDRPAGNCSAITPAPTQGCKEKGLEYMRTRFVPLFLCAFLFGLAQLFAIVLSMKLLCRSTFKNKAPAMGVKGASTWNAYDPDAGSFPPPAANTMA